MARERSISSAITTAHFDFLAIARSELLSANGPSVDSYFSSLTMKSHKGSWHARAIPRLALRWVTLSSVGSNLSRCRKMFFRPLSSMTTSWYSAEAPPVSFNALVTLFTRPLSRHLLVPSIDRVVFIGNVPIALMKPPTDKPNAGFWLQRKDRENTGVESRGVVACNASSYWHLKPDGFWHSS